MMVFGSRPVERTRWSGGNVRWGRVPTTAGQGSKSGRLRPLSMGNARRSNQLRALGVWSGNAGRARVVGLARST